MVDLETYRCPIGIYSGGFGGGSGAKGSGKGDFGENCSYSSLFNLPSVFKLPDSIIFLKLDIHSRTYEENLISSPYKNTKSKYIFFAHLLLFHDISFTLHDIFSISIRP